jgi:hypothetical protein
MCLVSIKDLDSFECEIYGSTMLTWSSMLVLSIELKAPHQKLADQGGDTSVKVKGFSGKSD